MAKNIEEIKIGVCDIYIDDGSGPVELGHTKGGVTVMYEPEVTDITCDQYGTTPVDKALTGEVLGAKTRLAQSTVDNIAHAITAADLETGEEGTKLEIGANSGVMFGERAVELRLHPIQNDPSDQSEDVVIYRAVVDSSFEMNYEIDNQRIVEIEFKALIDEDRSVGNRLGHIGVDSIS